MIKRKLGVRAHDFWKMAIGEMADCLRKYGFLVPQVVRPKAFSGISDYDDADNTVIREIKRSFGSETSRENLSEEERIAAYPRMLDSIQRIVETAAFYEMPFAIEPSIIRR